ncbi:MAG TPA: hypothetical protein VN214_03195 [Pseudomonas sp.]|nr:hypothetical protein [Pseudomonas sp.]
MSTSTVTSMANIIKVLAYLPWWFRAYVQAVKTFAYLAGLEVDWGVINAQAKKATRFREIEPHDEAKQ